MKIVEIFSIVLLITSACTKAMAEIIIHKDWTPIKGSYSSGNEKVLYIKEEGSNRIITVRLKDVSYVIEENYLDEETVRNYKAVDWKNYDFNRIKKKIQEKRSEEQKHVEKKPEKQKLEDLINSEKKTASTSSHFSFSSTAAHFYPRAGIYAGTSLPIGILNTIIDPGILILIFNDYTIPAITTDFRTGFIAGYALYDSNSQDFNAKVTLIPFIPYCEISHLTDYRFKPYFRIGVGIIRASLSDKSDSLESASAASVDGALMVGAGTGYFIENLPYLELLIDLNYMRVFELVSGDLFNISLGIAYHFSTERL